MTHLVNKRLRTLCVNKANQLEARMSRQTAFGVVKATTGEHGVHECVDGGDQEAIHPQVGDAS
jgi:hypothetical protein